ncbi:MAG: gliding motility lipoprotein GldH [Tannerellaceae bacterium]|jgi:gliding motility-associated lipoprotein GldH|nr:gliding motility lipoprotein GldH [Tannerellaceae bacterium]
MTDPVSKPNHREKGNLRSTRLLCLLCLICFSCENGVVYNQYRETDHSVWEKDKEYYFTFMIDDETTPYNIMFEVRNNNLYPYQNLWIFYTENPPAGPVRRDTVECVLADEFGKWSGKGISLFQSGFTLRQGYRFPVKGQYSFGFRQGMRNDALKGIQEIGLRIEKAG